MCHAPIPHVDCDHESFASEFAKPLLHDVWRLDGNTPNDHACSPGDEEIRNVFSRPHAASNVSANSRHAENRLDRLPVDDLSFFRPFEVDNVEKFESAIE